MDHLTRFVILLGPPGSGKGTQAARLAQKMGLVPISTGELLRREADSGSDIGNQVRTLLSSGLLVGNDLMNEVVVKRLAASDCQAGAIMDGYPRTIEQAHFLAELIQRERLSEPVVFDFVVSPEQVVERLSHRRQCPSCGQIYSAEFDVYGKDMVCESDGAPLIRRSDDNPDAIRQRLEIYQHNTRELVGFYKSRKYLAVDAMQSPDDIGTQLLALLDSQFKKRTVVVEPAVLNCYAS